MGWRRLLARLRAVRGRDNRAEELRREIDAHLPRIEDEYRPNGLPDDEARARARRTFGNATVARERAEDAWAFAWLASLLQDVRYAARMIRRAPGLSFTVIAIVSIAIAAST